MSPICISIGLVLLCYSLHACNARSFGVVHKDSAKDQFQFSTGKKNEQKLNPSSVSVKPDRKYSVADAPGEANMENRFKPEKANSEYNEPGKHFQDGIKGSVSRKSWKVGHRKRSGNQEAGFNLDYLPPRTHPPVHN
ncbi:hypothetical protein DH2020_023298 [Rehmannia glutinosa]|uniref:Uncharacterized protein n=1 Tax=Rehmannia glutinosa TaxID=99300 RepID=A0ABR0WA03_REHGL